MAKIKKFISIDFGATFIKLGIVDSNGLILEKRSFETKRFVKREALIAEILSQTRSLNNGDIAAISGVGVGVPGPVDYDKGIIFNLTNVKGFRGLKLRSILQRSLGIPVFLDNDANAACLGEAEWGAAKGKKYVMCITLGSGVGGGVILNGQIYRGRSYSAAELGHICIDRFGPECGCGSVGCLEAYAGNSYIVNEVGRRLKNGERSSVVRLAKGDLKAITPELLYKAAKAGDKFSRKIWAQVGYNLGIGLASIVNIINPEVIVIGGGVSKAGEMLLDPMEETLRSKAMPIFTKGLKIRKAKFVEMAGLIGGAALAKKGLAGI
ncbi:ROK family protein [Candidatus Omnitrophota bacterium]